VTWATRQEAFDAIDDRAADHPLEALRDYAEYLSAYRLDACATAESLAALIHAWDLLTPERREACTEASPLHRTKYVPNRLAFERLTARLRKEGRA
jgi:hypothetical protein